MEKPGVSAQHKQPGKVKSMITQGGGGEEDSEDSPVAHV